MLGFALFTLPGLVLGQELNTLLHEVEQHAPQLKSAHAKAEASIAGVKIAKSAYWGSAQVFGSADHYSSARLVNPISFPPNLTESLFDDDVYTYGASFTLPVDIDGRLSAKVKSLEFLSQATKQNALQTRLLMFGQAVSLYRGLQRLAGVKQALKQQSNALKEHYRTSSAAVDVGRMAKVELLRIDAEIKSVKGALAGLEGDEVRIRSGLAALIDKQEYSVVIPGLDRPPHAAHVNGDTNAYIVARPDIKAAKSLLQATEKNVLGAKREWLPKLALKAQTVYSEGDIASGANNWSAGVQLSWQFWDGGKRSANKDKAQAEQMAAQSQYQNLTNQARSQLKTAEARWHSASRQYDAAAAGEKSAIKTEQIQSDRFSEGRLSAVDLIDAEASLARARAEKISALANWWLADDQLYLASGLPPSAYKKIDDLSQLESTGE